MPSTLDLVRARPAAPPAPINLAGLTRAEIASALVESGAAPAAQARMRAGQVWGWVQHHGLTSFEAMSNIAKETRAALAERFTLARPQVVERQQSVDGTIKWLIRFAPGAPREAYFEGLAAWAKRGRPRDEAAAEFYRRHDNIWI